MFDDLLVTVIEYSYTGLILSHIVYKTFYSYLYSKEENEKMTTKIIILSTVGITSTLIIEKTIK